MARACDEGQAKQLLTINYSNSRFTSFIVEMFWDETREALVGVVQKAVLYDSDGIDLYFFNSQVVVEGLKTAQDVRSLFNRVDPRRSTPTAKALKRVTDPYMAKLEAHHASKQQGRNDIQPIKPLNIVILTDGAPDRNESPEGVIVVSRKDSINYLSKMEGNKLTNLITSRISAKD